MLNPVEIIIKKRSGLALSEAELKFMVDGYIKKSVPSYQMSALLMAIFFAGMSQQETYLLTKAYIDSGVSLNFAYPTVDKHSTGGVGDKVSIVLAPIVAACGGKIPMLSGRGLGHTGGTLDKLESIPSLTTDLSEARFRQIIDNCGFAIASQSEDMVPADKRIYALRDVSGTVESLPLITASIMSKKIAEGAGNLVIDLKVGSGAFMKEMTSARQLGSSLKRVGEAFGQKVKIVYTDMHNPIGQYIGNALEIKECIEYLKGGHYPDLHAIAQSLATEMLLLCDLAKSGQEAGKMVETSLTSGRALQSFKQFVRLQGGNPAVVDDTSLLPTAKHCVPIIATEAGYIQAIDSQAIGYALVELGAGRRQLTDSLDYSAGARLMVKIADKVSKGQNIGTVYCHQQEQGQAVARKIASTLKIVRRKVAVRELILGSE